MPCPEQVAFWRTHAQHLARDLQALHRRYLSKAFQAREAWNSAARWRLALVAVGSATALVLAHDWSEPDCAPLAVMVADELVPAPEQWLSTSGLPEAIAARRLVPGENQKIAPCLPGLEREIAGACWISIEQTPPCPQLTVAWEGRCLIPVARVHPTPLAMGIDGGTP